MATILTYKQQLQSVLWKNKRNEIVRRDNKKCQKCGKTTTLQVHHKYYDFNLNAWEYPNDCYITLCKTCHEKEHPEKIKAIKKSTKKLVLEVTFKIYVNENTNEYSLMRNVWKLDKKNIKSIELDKLSDEFDKIVK